MAERGTSGSGSGSTSGQKSFGEFLKGVATAADAAKTTRLVGTVHRGEKEGAFTLTLASGHALDLSAADVSNFNVVRDGANPTVEIDVPVEKLPRTWPPKLIKEGHKETAKDIIKEVALDPGGPKHPGKDPLKDVVKEGIKDAFKDPIKEGIKDGIQDPIFEGTGPIDPVKHAGLDTLDEGVGGGIGGGGGDPAAGRAGAGGAAGVGAAGGGLGGGIHPFMAPFAMATPHHAPAAAVAMQNLGAPGASPQLGPIQTQAIGEGPWTIKETWKDALADHKQLVTDQLVDTNPLADRPHTLAWIDHPQTIAWLDNPHTVPLLDQGGTGIIDTLVEGVGGGLGGTVNPGIWNLPGHLF